MQADDSKLKRQCYVMPDFVTQALEDHGLMQ